MPDSLTHAFFAMDVAKELKIKPIEDEREIYYVGAQGPDPFFYYRFYPWKKSNGIPKIGNMLHSNSTQKFFLNYLNKLKQSFSNDAYSFILGWVCHYSLDSTTHPYIFHVTGNYVKTDRNTYSYRGNHLQLERSIDSIFLRRRGYNSNKFKATKEVFTLSEIPKDIKSLLNHTLKETYDLENMGNEYNTSYKDFRSILNIICYDPYGIKKAIYRFLDIFNRKSKFVYKTFSYYNNVNPKIDYLNENHKEWLHPCDKDSSTESFMDLYNKAKEKAVYIISEIDKYISNERNELESVIKNITYDTGKDCSIKNEMKYFNAIL